MKNPKRKVLIKNKVRIRIRGNGEGCLFRRNGKGNFLMRYYVGSKRVELSSRTENKSKAKTQLARITSELHEIKSGRLLPSESKIIRSHSRCIKEHIEEYLKWCLRIDDPQSTRGVAQKKSHLYEWVEYLNLEQLIDITPEGLTRFLNYRQDIHKGRYGNLKTGMTVYNNVREHVISFANWCVKQSCLKEHSLKKVEPKKPAKDRRNNRRSLSLQEETMFRKSILNSVRESWYLLALELGLRKGDLQKLTWDNVNLSIRKSTVTIRDQKAKSRDADILPMTNPHLVKLLKQKFINQGSIKSGKVFLQTVTDRTRDRDFKNAGIEKFDLNGRKIDLHAMRMCLATTLNAKGVSQTIVQSIMRHSDPRTTMAFYNDPNSAASVEAKRKAMRESSHFSQAG